MSDVETMAQEPVVAGRAYDFRDWYWQADDGRIYSSKARAIVQADDPAFVEFQAAAMPTPWPRDDAGEQTDAALQAVFDGYDITVGGVPVTPESPLRIVVKSSSE